MTFCLDGGKIFLGPMKQFRKPHKHGKRFYNCPNESGEGIFTTFCMLMYNLCMSKKQQGQAAWITEPQIYPSHGVQPRITWIGHSSFYVQLGGYSILLDPVFGEFSSLYPRVLPAALGADQFPAVDFVVISHNHRDHMDEASLLGIKQKFPHVTVVVPEGNAHWFVRRGFERVHELSWWQNHSFQLPHAGLDSLTLTCLPAAHASQRIFFDKNRALWASWLLECSGRTIYFGGDTSYAEHFCEIGRAYPSLDVALLPIGPSEPRAWLQKSHIGPQEAVAAFLDLGAQHFVPMHWGAFPFAGERFDAPLISLQRWWAEQAGQLFGKTLHCLKVGQTLTCEPRITFVE